jgi:hypothetical protein
MKLTVVDMDEDNRMLRVGFGKNKGKWFSRLDLWWKGFRLSKKEPKKVTKSLRIGSAADEQFDEFVEPENAVIKVIVSSNVGQVGKYRLVHKMAHILAELGYSNVTTSDEMGNAVTCSMDELLPPSEKTISQQKRVHISIKIE